MSDVDLTSTGAAKDEGRRFNARRLSLHGLVAYHHVLAMV